MTASYFQHCPVPHRLPTPTEAGQGDSYFPSSQSKPGYPAKRKEGPTEEEKAPLPFPALLVHFLLQCHQLKSIRSSGKNPGHPFSQRSSFMAAVSDAFSFINLSLRLLQSQVSSTLKPQLCQALCLPTLCNFAMKTWLGTFRFADIL